MAAPDIGNPCMRVRVCESIANRRFHKNGGVDLFPVHQHSPSNSSGLRNNTNRRSSPCERHKRDPSDCHLKETIQIKPRRAHTPTRPRHRRDGIMGRATHLHAICFLLLALHGASGASDWPLYSQQCRDDAGPPYADDASTFGPNGFYHDGQAVEPVLDNDGKCSKPIEGACASRPTKKAAYMEGPIDCGGKGWYCRCVASTSSSSFLMTSSLIIYHAYPVAGHCLLHIVHYNAVHRRAETLTVSVACYII